MTPEANYNQPARMPVAPRGKILDRFKVDKTIGYLLLAAGILMIVTPIFLISNVLTGKSKPPQVFNVEAPTFDLPLSGQQLEVPKDVKIPAGLAMTQSGSVKTKIIPDEVFNSSLNIGVYYLLMVFIASSGSKIAGIGVKMIKDIKVQVKN